MTDPELAAWMAGRDDAARAARAMARRIRAGQRMTVIDGADPLEALQDSLNPRQWNAGCYLRDLWRDCLPGCELPGRYGGGAGHGGQRHLTHDEHLAAARAWQDYRAAMDELTRRATAAHAVAVKQCVIDCEPTIYEGFDEIITPLSGKDF
jgi:hypothetical protein